MEGMAQMARQFYNVNLLTHRFKNDKDITIILGSAISTRKNNIGIPNVSESTSILKKYFEDHNLSTLFSEFVEEYGTSNEYQDCFSFAAALNGQQLIRELVKSIVSVNIDRNTGKQNITKSIVDLVNFIKENPGKVINIVTTNFDTMIEEQLDNEGIAFNSHSIVSDSNYNDNSNGLINIIHIHGVWDKGDTMHTSNQLSAKRDLIESSLVNIISETNAYIMAYSGWEDSFMRSLATVMNNNKIEYQFSWCFYNKEHGIIERDYEDLFPLLTSAISRERIQFFSGVDCFNFFENCLVGNDVNKKKNN